MATRYFKKYNPLAKQWLSNGHYLQFNSNGNPKWAYLKSNDLEINENPEILAEIDAAIKNKVGSIHEITAAQYDAEFVKKNSTTQSQKLNWREEFGAIVPMDTLGPRVLQRPVAEDNPSALGSTVETIPRIPTKSLREMANLGHR